MPVWTRRLFPLVAIVLVTAACGSGQDAERAASSSVVVVTTTLPVGSSASSSSAAPGTTGATGSTGSTAGGASPTTAASDPGVATTAGSGAPATTAAPAPQTPVTPPTTTRSRLPVSGFGEVAFRIEGTPAQRCAMLAETDAQQSRGLMGRTNLAGYDGMLFVFSSNTTSGFWMKDTLIPLSIAFFRSDGRLVSTADMAPCVTATCPTYDAAGPYRYALEVPQGALGGLGIGPGAVISIGGACG